MTDTQLEAETAVSITVDGVEVTARPGELLIDACERSGTYIPRFCYHERMKPVGMCRMCLVEVDSGRGPALTPSCMVPVSEGMVVDTESETTKKAQDGVLEFLLINHPLDCPVCDKGGECPLQDQTMSFGPGESRFVEEKRHFEKPIAISDTVYLDRERCILCDRCTRFAKEVVGDPLIHFLGRGNQTEVNTFPDEPFSSYFSGNTVQICPVGALTAKPYRFKARPWDLDEVESTSMSDSIGSRIAVQASRNQVLRYLGVDSDPVNWGWLSDKERFSFEAFSHDDRLTEPFVRRGGDLEPISWSAALTAVGTALADTDPKRIGFIGGSRLTNESQYAFTKLAKGVLGTDNLDSQLGDGLAPGAILGFPRATIDSACTPGGTIVLLGPDPKETLGTLYIRLRHAAVEDGATIVELTPHRTGLAPYAKHHLYPAAGFTAAVASALVSGASQDVAGVAGADISAASQAISSGAPVTVIVGRASVSEDESAIVDAAIALSTLPNVRFLSALTRGNVHGSFDMGMSPGLLPGRVTLADAGQAASAWGSVPSAKGLSTGEMLEAAADGSIDLLVLLGADPAADFPDTELAHRALSAATVVAVDLFETASIGYAEVVLPAAAPHEAEGSFTNLEGRVSKVNQKVTPPGTARADWMIAAELARYAGGDLGFESLADLWSELAQVSAVHSSIDLETLDDNLRDGIIVEGALDAPEPSGRTPVAGDAYSLGLVVTRRMYDAGTILQHSPSSADLKAGTVLSLHPADFEALGIDTGSTVRLSSAKGSVQVPVEPNTDVPRGSAVLPANQGDISIGTLISVSDFVTYVRVERLGRND